MDLMTQIVRDRRYLESIQRRYQLSARDNQEIDNALDESMILFEGHDIDEGVMKMVFGKLRKVKEKIKDKADKNYEEYRKKGTEGQRRDAHGEKKLRQSSQKLNKINSKPTYRRSIG